MKYYKIWINQIGIFSGITLCVITLSGCGSFVINKAEIVGRGIEEKMVEEKTIEEEAVEEKAKEEEASSIKGRNEAKFHNPKDGIYTDGIITVEIISYDGIYEVHVEDGFHDKFYDLELVNNQLYIERIVTTNMMPEAENPYDEETHITLSWTEVTEGAFTYPGLNYHRDSTIVFQNMEYPDNTIETTEDSMLKKKVNTQ